MVLLDNTDFGLANCKAIESELLNEEKLIIETLNKVKQQRHSLYVEKLHLMNLCRSSSPENDIQEDTHENPIYELNEIMQPELDNMNIINLCAQYENLYNHEQLYLNVSNHLLSTQMDMDMEEFEEEVDEDDYNIEINMLMIGENNDSNN